MTAPIHTARITTQGRALVRAVGALGTIEPSGPFEQAIVGLLMAAYKRRHLCPIAMRTRVAMILLWHSRCDALLTLYLSGTGQVQYDPVRLGDSPHLALAALDKSGPLIQAGDR